MRRPGPRRLVQLYAALLYNAHLKGFITGEIYRGNSKSLCVPGLNCWSCPAAAGSCPLGALQQALASAGHTAPWYILGILLLFGVMLGRTVCGWLCPMGLIQELLHKIPTSKLKKSRTTRTLSGLKYIILAFLVIALPLIFGLNEDLPLPAFCRFLCPAGTLEGAVALLAHPANDALRASVGSLFILKSSLLGAILIACVFCFRAFCRFLCPLGAIYSLFNRFCLVGVRVDPDRCTGCGACVRNCKMDIRHVGDRECIHCGKCMECCPEKAISLKAGKLTLKGPEAAQQKPSKAKTAVKAILLLALLAALICFNLPGGNRAETPGAGRTLPDFSVECYDHSTFRLSDQRGKVVFINLWATYCAPCKTELPYFSDLQMRHRGRVAVLAVHAPLVTDDPREYWIKHDFRMPFATDADGSITELLGGRGVLPQTVVLNWKGEVVAVREGSVTPEILEELYDLADSGGSVSVTAEPLPSGPEGSSVTVLVKDWNGKPVRGVYLTVCSGSVCIQVATDWNGKAVVPNIVLPCEATVLNVPVGFLMPEETVLEITEPGETEITLSRDPIVFN